MAAAAAPAARVTSSADLWQLYVAVGTVYALLALRHFPFSLLYLLGVMCNN